MDGGDVDIRRLCIRCRHSSFGVDIAFSAFCPKRCIRVRDIVLRRDSVEWCCDDVEYAQFDVEALWRTRGCRCFAFDSKW